ncbi:protein-disulfide reductase DsbD domain-containing protein [Iodidimonas gelatinilytica]|nr:protein-disulfide reductase DsbD domain-containing protein [Iodidimonas gelatinilytica]
MMRLVMRVQATLFAMAILGLSLASLFVPLDRAMAAQPLAEISNPNSRLEIYAERTTVAAGQPLWLSLRFIPAQGWHTYWQNYGDSGKAPTFDWTLPAGWTVESPLYPLPHRIPVGPLMNYGYEAPQDLLVRVMPPADLPDQAFDLALSAEWLVCEEVCIPEFADLSFKMIPGKGSVTPDMAELFAKARAALPHDAPWQASARMSQDAFAVTIAMSPDDVSMASDAYFFPVTSGLIDYAGTQIATSGPDGLTLSVARSGHAPSMDSAAGVLILTNAAGQREGFALDVPIVMDPSLSVPDPADAGGFSGLELGLGQAILFALLGGMVLNLMPCVFPVLSLKAFSLIKAHGEGNVAARRDGLAIWPEFWSAFWALPLCFWLCAPPAQRLAGAFSCNRLSSLH